MAAKVNASSSAYPPAKTLKTKRKKVVSQNDATISALSLRVLSYLFENLGTRELFRIKRTSNKFAACVDHRLSQMRELDLGYTFTSGDLHHLFSTSRDLFLRVSKLSVNLFYHDPKNKVAYQTYERSIAKACKRYPTITDLTIHDQRVKQPLKFNQGWGAHLTRLKLIGCRLSSSMRLISECPQLKDVSLMHCMTDEGTFAESEIIQALPRIPLLSELELNNPSEETISSFAQHCQRAESKLANLTLTFGWGTRERMSAKSIRDLTTCTKLESLTIKFYQSSVPKPVVLPDAARQLISALPHTRLYLATMTTHEELSAYLADIE